MRRVSVREAGGGILLFLIFYLFIIWGLHQALDATGEPLVMAGGILFPRHGSRPALRAGSVESQPWAGRAVPGGWVLNKLQFDCGCCHHLESRIREARTGSESQSYKQFKTEIPLFPPPLPHLLALLSQRLLDWSLWLYCSFPRRFWKAVRLENLGVVTSTARLNTLGLPGRCSVCGEAGLMLVNHRAIVSTPWAGSGLKTAQCVCPFYVPSAKEGQILSLCE